MPETNPLENARYELARLVQAKSEIEQRIAAIQQTIQILEPVYGAESNFGVRGLNALAMTRSDGGLTDRIRAVLLRSSPFGITPLAVRDVVIQGGFELGERSNFLAEIHNVLKRLVAQGEAEEITTEESGKMYRPRRASGNLKDLANTKPVPAPTGYRKITVRPSGDKK
jgi:hypothetical protein